MKNFSRKYHNRGSFGHGYSSLAVRHNEYTWSQTGGTRGPGVVFSISREGPSDVVLSPVQLRALIDQLAPFVAPLVEPPLWTDE